MHALVEALAEAGAATFAFEEDAADEDAGAMGVGYSVGALSTARL